MTQSINEQIHQLNKEIASTSARLIAVSKTKPNSMIEEAYAGGQREFGENKVQELVEKNDALPNDIIWHMIGHLQRNKVKYIAPFVHLIHGVDTEKLLKEINKEGKKNDRVIDCLLQVHIADENTKFGFSSDELLALLQSESLSSLQNIRIKGLMGMATNTTDQSKVSTEFASLKTLFDEVHNNVKGDNIDFQEISMGMSGDYKLAIAQGSTMIRIGSTIFGARDYTV
ncbi:MAG: YggS family pyridoxal phosphate-dependent enzyme [Reichenbachiella sp.]